VRNSPTTVEQSIAGDQRGIETGIDRETPKSVIVKDVNVVSPEYIVMSEKRFSLRWAGKRRNGSMLEFKIL
jgi:hypothetical protein